jgi:hypothetical protein
VKTEEVVADEEKRRRQVYRQWRKRTCVYVIGSPEFRAVKVGYGFPEERLSSFQTGSPFALELLETFPGGRDLEWALHESFGRYRIRGEWFEFPEGRDVLSVIRAEYEQIKRNFPEWCGAR